MAIFIFSSKMYAPASGSRKLLGQRNPAHRGFRNVVFRARGWAELPPSSADRAAVVMIVCLADLVFLKVTELAAFGFAASDQMKQTSIQNVVVSLLRLAGIVALVATVHQVTLDRWVVVYLLTSLMGTGYAVWKGSLLWGHPATNLAALREDVVEGVFFSSPARPRRSITTSTR